MKKIILIATALVFAICAADARASDKMDLMLKMLTAEPVEAKAMLGKAVAERGGVTQVDVLIKSSDVDLTATAIEDAGGIVRSVIGDIMTAFVPVDFLTTLDGLDEVSGIEASKMLRSLNDSSRANTGVATLQADFEGVAYNGANVVVGVIDTGLDYSSNDFDNSSATTRVQYLRFQTASGTSISVTECANDKIVDGTCTIPATNDSPTSHGTHVAGIAAGSDSTYTGCAPAADIMMVRNDFSDDIDEGDGTFSGGVLDGVDEIFKKADILDKPAVVNLSQGTHIGAHDNTSLLEQGINSAVEGGYKTSGGKSYGRSVVVAAGNEHIVDAILGSTSSLAGGIHATINVADGASQAWRLWVLDISDESGVYAPGRTPLIADAWLGSGQAGKCSVAANVYAYTSATSGATTTSDAVAATGDVLISSEGTATAQSTNKKAKAIIATDASDAQNQKPRALFGYSPGESGTWVDIETDASSTGYVMDVIVRASGGSCTGNMWIEGGGSYVNFMKNIDTGAFDVANGDNGNGYSFSVGDNSMTIDIPGTASGVITVGAYLQPKPAGGSTSKWTAENGTTYDATNISEPSTAQVNGGTVGSRCPFSSIGPTADNRTKPDIMAPGDPIISTLATGYDLDDSPPLIVNSGHFKLQGTSQATPHIAGLVALLYQKNNRLTAADVKSAITGTATAAMVVGKASNENGYGKVNATAAMSSISSDTSGYAGVGTLKTSDLEEDDDDGGTTTSSGCGGSTIAPFSSASATAMALLIALPAVVIAVKRRRRR